MERVCDDDGEHSESTLHLVLDKVFRVHVGVPVDHVPVIIPAPHPVILSLVTFARVAAVMAISEFKCLLSGADPLGAKAGAVIVANVTEEGPHQEHLPLLPSEALPVVFGIVGVG